MKGWHKHGVCSEKHWPYKAAKRAAADFEQRFEDALRRPLGAYLRVNHKDIIAMHSAISEVGILYATSQVHSGWSDIGPDGIIAFSESLKCSAAAFAIVETTSGVWIQNWGSGLGFQGFAWAATTLALSGVLRVRASSRRSIVGVQSVAAAWPASAGSRSYVFCDLRPHIISLGNDGLLRTDGTYGTSSEDVDEIFAHVRKQGARHQHLLLYAHGGLTAEDAAIQKVADLRGPLLEAGVYPRRWSGKTDFWTTLQHPRRGGRHAGRRPA